MNRVLLLRVALIMAVLLLTLGIGIVILLRSQRRTRQYNERVAEIVARPNAASSTPAARAGLMMTAEATHSFRFERLVRLLTRSPQRSRDELVQLWIILAVGFAAAVFLTRFLHEVIGFLALPIPIVLPVVLSRAIFGWRDQRLENAYRQQFPEALAIIVRTVRVGVPVVEALRIVARESEDPTAAEFTYLINRIAIGIPVGDALHSTADRTGLTEHRLFATAVSLQSQTGGGLTETLSGLGATVRKRIMARERARAMASEAQTTAYILGALPIVTGGLLGLVNPTYVGVLFTDPGGNILLTIACTSLLTGFFVMRLIIHKSLT